MHSDQAEVQQSIRKYMMVGGALLAFTVITVLASYLNLGVGFGIALALAIAGMKGSMVAGVFMHLSHEKQWIYGSLILTVVFFIVLIFVPLFTTHDTISVGLPWSH